MTRFLLPATALIALALTLPARADTISLANGGQVPGTIIRVLLKIGPIDKDLPRDQVRSIRIDGKEWQVIASDGTRYIGRLDSVSIRSENRELTFAGNTVKAIELQTEEAKPAEKPKAPKPPIEEPVIPEPGQNPPGEVQPRDLPGAAELLESLTPAQKQKLRTVTALRDKCLKQADQLAAAEYEAIRDEYADKWRKASQEVEALRKAVRQSDKPVRKPSESKPAAGSLSTVVPGGTPADALAAAQAKKDQLETAIKIQKAAVKDRADRRKERIYAFYTDICQQLIEGNTITQDAMRKIFEKALAGVK